MKPFRIAFAAVFVAALSRPALGAELLDGKLYLNGYGGAVYARTQHYTYGTGTPDGEYDANFSLGVQSRLYDDLVAGASIQANDDGTVELDWAFIEWRLADLFRLRAGKVKQPIGIYAEVKDIGTVRPFFTAPDSVYGPLGITAESYLGAGATGQVGSPRSWSLLYDAYVGELRAQTLDLSGALQPGATPQAVGVDSDHLERLVGGRLTLTTPLKGLSVKFSAYRAMRMEALGGVLRRQVVFGPSIEFLTDTLSVRAEYFHLKHDAETLDSGYLEVAQYLGEHFQIAGRLEAAHSDYEGVPDSSFSRHREAAVGLNYWINPDMVLKASIHFIDGNRLVVPDLVGPGPSPDARTWMAMLGIQFTL